MDVGISTLSLSVRSGAQLKLRILVISRLASGWRCKVMSNRHFAELPKWEGLKTAYQLSQSSISAARGKSHEHAKNHTRCGR